MPIPEKVKRQLVNKPIVDCAFVKVIRDCPLNEKLKRDPFVDLFGNKSTKRRPFLYDYDVLIDGVKLGTFENIHTGRGYYLENLKGDRYLFIGSPTVRKIDAQADFTKITLEAHANGFFVTPRTADVHKRKEARKREQARKRAHADAVKRTIQSYGTQMYHLINLMAVATEVDQAQICIEKAHALVSNIKRALPKMKDADQ